MRRKLLSLSYFIRPSWVQCSEFPFDLCQFTCSALDRKKVVPPADSGHLFWLFTVRSVARTRGQISSYKWVHWSLNMGPAVQMITWGEEVNDIHLCHCNSICKRVRERGKSILDIGTVDHGMVVVITLLQLSQVERLIRENERERERIRMRSKYTLHPPLFRVAGIEESETESRVPCWSCVNAWKGMNYWRDRKKRPMIFSSLWLLLWDSIRTVPRSISRLHLS